MEPRGRGKIHRGKDGAEVKPAPSYADRDIIPWRFCLIPVAVVAAGLAFGAVLVAIAGQFHPFACFP